MEGGALSVTSELICQNDRFRQTMGDEPGIEHEPPSILSGQERGGPARGVEINRLLQRQGGEFAVVGHVSTS